MTIKGDRRNKMSDEAYKESIKALDNVTDVFWNARAALSSAPTKYEADFAAFKLMQLVWLHVNSVSHLAAIPYAGSHLASAWVLARSAFETGATALWLAMDDDWKEREARWLGWVTSEEDYWAKLAKEFESLNPSFAASSIERARLHKERREAITRLLPKDSRSKRPAMPQLLKEVGMDQRYYIPYRITSHIVHGGAGADEWAIQRKGDVISFGHASGLSSWKDLFRMASWSIVQPGTVVLARSGASSVACRQLLSCHENLVDVTERLENRS
jgi:hypothetical protein